VRRARPGVYRVTDARRLYLKKASAAAGSYFLRYRMNGKRPEMGLGSITEISIDAARDLAGKLGGKPKTGVDPLTERRRAAAAELERKQEEARRAAIPTVKQAVEAYLEDHARKWRHARAEQDWFNPIRTYAYPVIGDHKVDAVETDDIADILRAVYAKGLSSVGRKLRVNLKAVFDASIARGHRAKALGNPADKDEIKAIVSPGKHVTGNYRRIELDDAPSAFARLLQTARSAENNVAAVAWVFMALTAARPSEALEARWDQIKLDKAGGPIWLNPALKTREPGKPLRVPLSKIALEILDAMRTVRKGDYIFPGQNGQRLAYSTFKDTPMKAKIEAGTPHSWRSIFRDVAEDECKATHETAELALSHSLGKVEGSYRRGDALEQRRKLMQAYENWLTGKAEAPMSSRFPGGPDVSS
jgi:integrase